MFTMFKHGAHCIDSVIIFQILIPLSKGWPRDAVCSTTVLLQPQAAAAMAAV